MKIFPERFAKGTDSLRRIRVTGHVDWGKPRQIKKDKKAEISLQFLIMGIVGIFILAIIFLNPSVMDFIAKKLPNIIPNYNSTQPAQTLPEILRYSIQDDKVEYYDGLNWNQFPADTNQEIKVGVKSMSQNTARFYFAQYYYRNQRSLPTEYTLSEGNKINQNTNPAISYFGKYSVQEFSEATKGKIFITAPVYFLGTNNGVQYQVLSLNTDDSITTKQTTSKFQLDAAIVSGSNGLQFSIRIKDNDPLFQETRLHLKNIDGSMYPIDTKNPQIADNLNNGEQDFINYINAAGQSEKTFTGKDGTVYKMIAQSVLSSKDEVVYQFYVDKNSEPIPIYYSLVRNRPNWAEAAIAWRSASLGDRMFVAGIGSEQPASLGKPENEIKQNIIAWRDSIFQTPMTFRYNKDSGCVKVKVEKIGANSKTYLTADLSKGETC